MLGNFQVAGRLLAFHKELGSMELELSDDVPSHSVCTRLNILCRLKYKNLWKT
jgi:hypothetical protein